MEAQTQMTDEPDERRVFEAVLTTRGRVTVPKELRRLLELESGGPVELIDLGDVIEIRRPVQPKEDDDG